MSPEGISQDPEALDRKFVDFVDEHTRAVGDLSQPALMSEGLYGVAVTPDQFLPFDVVEFAEYRETGEDLEIDPALVEEAEITLCIGELQVITLIYNLFTYEYSLVLNGVRKDLSDKYRYLPARVVDALIKAEDEGRLTESEDPDGTK